MLFSQYPLYACRLISHPLWHACMHAHFSVPLPCMHARVSAPIPCTHANLLVTLTCLHAHFSVGLPCVHRCSHTCACNSFFSMEAHMRACTNNRVLAKFSHCYLRTCHTACPHPRYDGGESGISAWNIRCKVVF